ncbi:melanoma antigen preferentially expressed in tumors-like [Echinops telfairi]|uniref:Melanoma antigen preferentially expressed in tumors-like n=1 Tax=Echinops telfairi TaxID=9371 RepID=A0AC55CPB0_ECHTE|nr:melanoma antigen preferentially expressed in tumors-like [Echinops telfairi]
MSSRNPPRLLDLAIQSVLQDEAAAIDALEWLPTQLFPPLFMAAVVGEHRETIKAMVGVWPFLKLPLGALMEDCPSPPDVLKAALDGLAILLSQKGKHRRCKLKVLDLQVNTGTNFWKVWAGAESTASMTPSEDAESTQPHTQIPKEDKSRSVEKHPALAGMTVLTDLCLQEDIPDELLTFLIERVKQRKDLPHLCCRKIKFIWNVAHLSILGEILNMVQLDSVQEVRLLGSWDLQRLNWFAPYLAQMIHLHTLILSECTLYCIVPGEEDKDEVQKLLQQFTSRLLSLDQLQTLILHSARFLDNHLYQLLRSLQGPLDTLHISHSSLMDHDLTYLSSCPCTSHLKSLDLSGDCFGSRMMSMRRRNARRIVDLAIQTVLRNETSVIAALEWLPTELFLPFFMEAVVGGHTEIVKAMRIQ